MNNDVPVYTEKTAIAKTTTDVSFAKGSKVLVTMSLKDTEATNKNGQNVAVIDYVQAAAIDVAASESKIGKLTGASDINYTETVSIDGTKYNTNCRFVLGKDKAMNIANNGATYTFYFDSYGNVIGRTANTTAASLTLSWIVSMRLTRTAKFI